MDYLIFAVRIPRPVDVRFDGFSRRITNRGRRYRTWNVCVVTAIEVFLKKLYAVYD